MGAVNAARPSGAPQTPASTYSLANRPASVHELEQALHLGKGSIATNEPLANLSYDALNLLGLDVARARDYHGSYDIQDYIDGKPLPDDPTSGLGRYATDTTPLQESRAQEAGQPPSPPYAEMVVTNPVVQLQDTDFAGQAGNMVSGMMSEAMALLNSAKNPDGTINIANQLRAQQLMNDAKNLYEMVSKLLQMLSDMQKTAIENMK
jgi:hypothetical protein